MEVGKESACAGGFDFTDDAAPTFVSLLLRGDIDGKDQPPLTINTGPSMSAQSTAVPPPSSGSGSGSSSTGTVVAVVAGGGALAAIAWLVLKTPLSIFGGRR